ncbi:unnamed protein product [Scytosiphon promiscuus]
MPAPQQTLAADVRNRGRFFRVTQGCDRTPQTASCPHLTLEYQPPLYLSLCYRAPFPCSGFVRWCVLVCATCVSTAIRGAADVVLGVVTPRTFHLPSRCSPTSSESPDVDRPPTSCTSRSP